MRSPKASPVPAAFATPDAGAVEGEAGRPARASRPSKAPPTAGVGPVSRSQPDDATAGASAGATTGVGAGAAPGRPPAAWSCRAAARRASGETCDCAAKACTAASRSAGISPPAAAASRAPGPAVGAACSPKSRPWGSPDPEEEASTVLFCARPAATAADNGCFSHLLVSKLNCAGREVTSMGLEKSVGTAGLASSKPRRSLTPLPLLFAACPLGSSISPSIRSGGGRAGMSFGGGGGEPLKGFGRSSLLAPCPLLAPPPACSLPLSASPPPPPSASRFSFIFSAWARRIAFSFCTRFTVVGMRTPSATLFFFSSSSHWPLMSQSMAACVLFWCFRRAFRAGPSSKPWDSKDESDRGSTGKETPESPSAGSSFTFLSMRRAEKSIMPVLGAPATSASLSSFFCNSISTWASRCSGVISTMGRNSMRVGRDVEMACAELAKNSYSRYLSVCSVESKISPRYSSRM
mmetsp:Transcript_121356/g.387934  ORF Transcript_121356/g.387934 Transcript_121356/m.387934 type:complete len:464 (+) Transcript_121356:183-1574(+)